MRLGDTIATYDVALALRGESGKFDLTSPTGEIYHVTCNANQSIISLQFAANGSNPRPFLIRKVAEPVPDVRETALDLAAEPVPSLATRTPFIVNADDINPGSEAKATGRQLEAPGSDPEMQDVFNLDLASSEAEPNQQPTAWVCARGAMQQDRGNLLTGACVNFNEFDAEVRRLQAQLDDIRYRARKKFYQAQVVAAGA